MRPSFSAALCAAVVSSITSSASAFQGGMFRGGGDGPGKPPHSTSGGSSPASSLASSPAVRATAGGGPEIPFTDEPWEFWWEFNHDRLLNLRPTLARRPANGMGSAFEPIDHSVKSQVLLPFLLQQLRDRDDQVRSASVFALARTGLSDVVPYLRHTLAVDPSRLVRENVVLALGQVRSTRAIDTLHQLLDDSTAPDELRAYAAVALGSCSLAEASVVLRECYAGAREGGIPYTLRTAVLYALGLTEDSTNAPFLRDLAVRGESDERLRALIVLGLGRVGDHSSTALLVSALQDNGAQVRRSAAIALGVVADAMDDATRESLQRTALRDSDGVVRNFADIALGRIAARGSAPATEFLLRELRDTTSRRRGFLAIALGLSQSENARGPLLQMFRTESSHSLQAAAALGLGLCKHTEAAPVLRQSLERNRDPYLRGYLALSLGLLGDEASLETLQACLEQSTGPECSRWITVALALLGDPTLQEKLEDLAHAGSSWQRTTAAYSMGLVGDRGSLEFLQERASARDETELVRVYASYALGMLCDRDSEPVVSVYARDHNYTDDLPFLRELYFLF